MSKIEQVDFFSLNEIHCTVDELPNALSTILKSYGNEVTRITEESVRKVTKETKEIVKDSGDYKDRRPKYRKSIRYRIDPSLNGASGVVYAGGHEYSLTHLLEKGHRIWNAPGHSTHEHKHWRTGEDYAQKELPSILMKELG